MLKIKLKNFTHITNRIATKTKEQVAYGAMAMLAEKGYIADK